MNWKQVRLGDICESRLGKTMNASTDTGEARQYLCAVNVKWDEFDFSTLKNAPFSPDEIMKYTVQKGDLLICEGGDTGRAAIWDKDEPIQYQNALHRVRFKDGTALPRFCLHFLHYLKLCGILDKEYSHGATILHLVTRSLYSITMPLPSLCEQQRIVEVLDAEFAKIDALKANAEKNLQNAKDLFQSSLKKELEPKDGWRYISIEDIAELKGGKRVPKGYKLEKEPTSHPYIRVADFNNRGSIDLDDIHYISDEVFNGIKRYIITTDDVYISIAGTIGKSGIIPSVLNGANLTENACRLVFKEKVNNKYIYYCTISLSFREQITALTMQAAQPKLALTRLATARIYIPTLLEQDKIVKTLDSIKEMCEAIQENYTKTIALCDDLKQALLRKAFNGEL